MMKFIKDNLGNVANGIVVVSCIATVVLWSHHGLSKEIQEIRVDTKLAHARIDATNQRIDRTYDLILEIVREGKKDKHKDEAR